ncbi:hypothetical protein B0H13DRAFT_2018230 [Mycena leptocephala]|nr:hypothetical protein B0H13DRAFT_2018230 [Mycena leptocephala]
MLVIFARFCTLFRPIFSSLWSWARLLFNSGGAGSDDIEMGGNGRIANSNGKPSQCSGTDRIYETNSLAGNSAQSIASPLLDIQNALPGAEMRSQPPEFRTRCGSKYNEPANHSIRVPLGNTLKRVEAHLDLPSEPQHVETPLSATGPFRETSFTPGSIGWQSDKLKLLDEARAWSTRVKINSYAHRRSLPSHTSSTPVIERALANIRHESAPANLDGTRHSCEEACSLRGKTYVEESPPLTRRLLHSPASRGPSELPYCGPSLQPLAGSLSSYGSDGTLTDVIDSLEAVFTTSKWQSLVDLNGAAAREEVRSLGYAMA